jgi:hypothetical protein
VLADLYEGQELAEIRVVKGSAFAAGLIQGSSSLPTPLVKPLVTY